MSSRRPPLLLAASLLFVSACEAPGPRTTAAYDAEPPTTIGIALPFDRTSTPGAADTVRELWSTHLAKRGWHVVPPRQADAVLRSTIETWNRQSGSDTARVTVEARLERRSDGALLWHDTGRGSESDRSDDDDDPGPAESMFDWAFEEAWEGVVARPLGTSTRSDDLRRAADDGVAQALRSLPDAPGR